MDGRAFLEVARVLAAATGEAFWRSAAGRAYYALLYEGEAALERWGIAIPPKADLHSFIRMRLSYPADLDLKRVGKALDRLGRWRNYADYRLPSPGPFGVPDAANEAVQYATEAIELLDQIDADPARRAAAVAAIRAAFAP